MFIEAQTRPLVIAVMRDDGVVKPHPPVTRVLEDVAAKLEMAGHEIISWTPGSLHQECIDIMVRASPDILVSTSADPTYRTSTTQQMEEKT
jgi:Asp-tRNA(Asn)/Glu-tRNA(Gln) amidotransferase A subunit family amidase